MKNFIVKSFNRLLVFLAGALGFAGCDHSNWPAYGCPPEPYNILNISGFVVDENGDPIKDIEVSYAQVKGTEDSDTIVVDKIKSKQDGSFALDIYCYQEPIGMEKHLVIATDVDGETNGSYETDVKTLDLDDQQFYSTRKITFVLREKPTASEPEDNGEDEQA